MSQPIPRILIVDDQTVIRGTMAGIIEDLGFQVFDVEDGYRAIAEVKSTRFDLVFLDIKMPGINGVQTFREIKKLRPNTLVVMMTGFDVGELIDESLDEGAHGVSDDPAHFRGVASLHHGPFLGSQGRRSRGGREQETGVEIHLLDDHAQAFDGVLGGDKSSFLACLNRAPPDPLEDLIVLCFPLGIEVGNRHIVLTIGYAGGKN